MQCIKSKQVSASWCVDCSSATSTHSSAVIVKQVSSQVTYNALPCSIPLYRCSFHWSANHELDEVRLVEGTGIVSTADCCVLLPGICTEGLCLHLGLVFDGQLAVYARDNINPATLYTHIQYHGLTTLPVVQMFCCCRSSSVPDPQCLF